MLFMRGAGPIGYPGAAEVVNMQPPAALIKQGINVAALHRRRPPVRHLGLALDPQRLAGGGGRRRAGAAEDRRPRAHRPQQGHRQHPDLGRGAGASGARRWRSSGGYHVSRRARRRGRKSSAAWSTSSTSGMVLKPAVKYQRRRADQGRAAGQSLTASQPIRAVERVLIEPLAMPHPRRKAQRLSPPARARLLRHSQSVGRRQRALSAASRLQGAGDDERGGFALGRPDPDGA